MNAVSLCNEKEQLVLALWACSQSIKESARQLKISERTVDYYRGRLKCRFGVHSSNELIRKIIMMDEYESLIRLGRNLLIVNS
ncbi:MAG: helix-turn-helix transcriptional regulator [Gammaproteobacteria bacterium]